ncbi:MAG: alpha-L-fucosidase [Planctomycetota bacterium]|jgi:alpha-L-fucosidase
MSNDLLLSPVEPTIQSLGMAYEAPQWFRDAKFGIYMHWGVYSVVGRAEWYGRHMYIPGHEDNEYHIKTYGHPSTFGYKDLIPLWKAEKFDAEAMLDVVKRAGAKYFSPCAVHHDNFDLWDSTRYHKWNAANMGPKKDLIGMLRDATRAAGLRWGCTTHLARSVSWFNTNKNSDADGAYDGNDPAYQDYYHGPSDDQSSWHPADPAAAWRELWRNRMMDLIDRYEPDLLYFDGALPFRGEDDFQSGLDVVAHYYNRSIERHGKLDSVMFLKDIDEYMGAFSHGMFANNVASLDLEQRGANRLIYRPWQTDFNVVKGGWSYNPNDDLYGPEELIHLLIDVVSKYGCLLLNIPPTPAGELEPRVIDLLGEIGDWLTVNGEAIYGTRPFKEFGEGGVRFTTDGDALNAILLNWPEGGGLTLKLLASGENAAVVKSVSLLATGEALPFEQTADGLTITLPPDPPGALKHAFVIQATCDRDMKPTWLR